MNDLSQPAVYAKPDPPTSSVASSPPPGYPASPISQQGGFYAPMAQEQMRQTPVNDVFGRPPPMHPGAGYANTGMYAPPAQGVSAVSPPPPQSVSPATPINPYQPAPVAPPVELSGVTREY